MCGLFGIIRPSGVTPDDELALGKIGQQLLHRGPDGSGYIRDSKLLLGMHRLSIMDPSRGWQPFWSEDERWGVLGNGEIYNASTLRLELEGKGHRFMSRSDIEVVPHLVEELGQEAFGRLRGMFALMVFDRFKGKLHLVRDRLGEKPLAFWRSNGAIFLASEQSALVRAGLVPLKVDTSQLSAYLLHGFTPEPNSLIAGVHKVPAGHIVTITLSDGAISEYQYWDPERQVGDATLTDADLVDEIKDAVIASCTSDVPVGIALSGGLDSSLVAALASQTRTDLHAFTIGYSASGHDESHLAQALAKHLGIPCHTTILNTHDVANDFAQVCASRDEPISDIAGPAIAAVPRSASEAGVPVLLTGVGGDELFWGYDWIRRLAAWMTTYLENVESGRDVSRARFNPPPRSRQAQVDWLLDGAGRRSDRRLRKFVSSSVSGSLTPLPFYEFQPGYLSLHKALGDLVPAEGRAGLTEFRGPARSNLMAPLYMIASNATYLRVNSFVQIDRLSMKFSVESRTPLADGNLVSRVLSAGLRDRDHLLPPKTRLRALSRGLLPEDVLARPKRGFTPPVREWMRAIWQANSQALDASASIALAGLSDQAARHWIADPISRNGRINQVGLRLMTLELWLRSLN